MTKKCNIPDAPKKLMAVAPICDIIRAAKTVDCLSDLSKHITYLIDYIEQTSTSGSDPIHLPISILADVPDKPIPISFMWLWTLLVVEFGTYNDNVKHGWITRPEDAVVCLRFVADDDEKEDSDGKE